MGLVRKGAGEAHGHLEAEMSVKTRVDEILAQHPGRYSLDQAIAIAVTEQANHKDSFLVMREAALGGSK